MKKLFLIFACLPLLLLAEEKEIPRKILALYDSNFNKDVSATIVHKAAEMPLNHLGLKVHYVDVNQPLPNVNEVEDVLGVLVWSYEWKFEDPKVAKGLLLWLNRLSDEGKKIVVMGAPPFEGETFKLPLSKRNRFWKRLGLKDTDEWVNLTVQTQLEYKNEGLFRFERGYPTVLPTYDRMVPLAKKTECCLLAQEKDFRESVSALVTINDRGAYVANQYAIYWVYGNETAKRGWYINPFAFFEKAFGLEGMARLDTTTLNGRRIYYSHIDGDGWNSRSEIHEYKDEHAISAKVLLDEILKAHPELPVTVGPITADVDPSWYGNEESLQVLKEIADLPQVELASHSFTHPFAWGFFRHYHPHDEYPFAHLYPKGSWLGRGVVAWMRVHMGGYDDTIVEEEYAPSEPKDLHLYNEEYDVPRAYAKKPFSLPLEVHGSVEETNKLVEGKKKVSLYLWSGDCLPFKEALAEVKKEGICNLNGGDSRFDTKFNSYSWVTPLARELDGELQVYSSNSNENTYTDYWRDNFHAFNMLPETFENTESPIRVKPMNIYYHVYSAEKLPGLNAVKQNIEYAKSQEMFPIHAREYSEIVEGFFTARLVDLGEGRVKILDRNSLQTVRFDHAADQAVDFSRSVGVLGQRHYQGSLYVFLDPEVGEPEVALTSLDVLKVEPQEERFYLRSSSWKVTQIKEEGTSLSFEASGYGPLEMSWNAPENGEYEVQIGSAKPFRVGVAYQQLNFKVPLLQKEALPVKISKAKSRRKVG